MFIITIYSLLIFSQGIHLAPSVAFHSLIIAPKAICTTEDTYVASDIININF